jgi:predicted methyltransferase
VHAAARCGHASLRSLIPSLEIVMQYARAAIATLLLSTAVAAPAWALQAAPAVSSAAAAGTAQSALNTAIAGSWRLPSNRARDIYRHPAATLAFFGVQPGQTVIEITPGGGWYSEILAPLLHDQGEYVAALFAPSTGEGAARSEAALKRKFSFDAAHYGKAQIVEFDAKAPVLGAAGSADRVLTFRNVHNWTDDGTAATMFKAFFTVLKPGGVLGVVDHRAGAGSNAQDSGYLRTEDVIKLATDAGFKLDGSSEINANPKDTKNYPKGVWTLPPSYALGEQDKAKYQAIGESDRMTLRFVKPASAP